MPGPQDRVLKPTPAPDHAPPGQSDISKEGNRPAENDAPREARGEPRADLRERLKRLPPNHPSSPLRDDGSRSPFSPDGTNDDLPSPDEVELTAERTRDTTSVPKDQADQDLDAQDRARIDPDGSWHWKGRDLLPDRSRIADSVIEKCRGVEGRDVNGKYGEHGLTPAMWRVEANLEHGQLVEGTEKYALKSPDRFKEKLAKLISDEPDCDTQELASRINDGIRYTFCYADDRYSSGVMEVLEAMTTAGFELYERKNAWADHAKSYKGVNSTWLDPDSGLRFEVQVHTRASWEAKQESHREYEIIESLRATPEEKMKARDRQDRVFAEVPVPPNARHIPSYRREDW